MVHLRRAIGMAGTKPGTMSSSVREMYNREIVENPEGATNYTYLQSQLCIKKMRRRRRPHNPSTIKELIDILNQQQNTAYASTMQNPSSNFFYQQLPFMVEGERIGIVFANLDAIEKYRNELFTITLTKGCLLTFQVVLKNVSFPMVYTLTTKMTQAAYEIAREILPLNYAELKIITDFERGLMNAVESTFPESRFQGCWFHYCQVSYCRRSINSIFNSFQTSPEAAKILHMILALPHLPAEVQPTCRFTIFNGFEVIVEFVNQHPNIYHRLDIFINGYVAEFWLMQIGAASISVYGPRNKSLYCVNLFETLDVYIWEFYLKGREFVHQAEMLDRSDGHLRQNSAIRHQGTHAGQLVLLLMLMLLLSPLDDHLLRLRSLQHMQHLVVVIKVNHGMLRKRNKRENVNTV
ncbi:hypothetical protein QTP88_000565 [Uroleucon formosanum]